MPLIKPFACLAHHIRHWTIKFGWSKQPLPTFSTNSGEQYQNTIHTQSYTVIWYDAKFKPAIKKTSQSNLNVGY